MPCLDAGAYGGNFSFLYRRLYPDFLAQRSAEWGNGNVHVFEYYCDDGEMRWTNWSGDDAGWEQWEAMEGCQSGDTIGMLLDFDEGTLAVYKNNRRLGVLKDGLSWAILLACQSQLGVRRFYQERRTSQRLRKKLFQLSVS